MKLQYVVNKQKNGFAVSMEMLQFEGCGLTRNSVCPLTSSESGMDGEAFYGQTRPHHMASNGDSAEKLTRQAGQFPDMCPQTEKAA
jgi:hypothetical protein